VFTAFQCEDIYKIWYPSSYVLQMFTNLANLGIFWCLKWEKN